VASAKKPIGASAEQDDKLRADPERAGGAGSSRSSMWSEPESNRACGATVAKSCRTMPLVDRLFDSVRGTP
jgi:hypothetical protein